MTLSEASLITEIPAILDEIQSNYFKEASSRLKENTVIDNEDEFYAFSSQRKALSKASGVKIKQSKKNYKKNFLSVLDVMHLKMNKRKMYFHWKTW